MSILINKKTKVICQGFTGAQGLAQRTGARVRNQTRRRRDTPARAALDTWVFRCSTPFATPSMQRMRRVDHYVPAPFGKDSILEAIDAGLKLIICFTEGSRRSICSRSRHVCRSATRV
jgi:succinyl-CoA synthetase alpha subunit